MKDRSDDPSHHERMFLPRRCSSLDRSVMGGPMFFLQTYSLFLLVLFTSLKIIQDIIMLSKIVMSHSIRSYERLFSKIIYTNIT